MGGAIVLFGIIGFLIGVAIGAALLRIGCQIVKVPVPEFGKAMGVVIVAAIASFAVSFMFGFTMGAMIGADPTALRVIQIINLPISACLYATIYMAMLPTTFGKGLLIWLVQAAVVFAIVIVVVIVLFATGSMHG
ncbi:MAG: hypothetical protein GC159_14630 [Phycisphaera sp.]|nr:hypothetical protein [Phycisphaera sp.]